MYTDEDLYQAAEVGIFDKGAVESFREFIAKRNDTASVDEENFRLVSGFNDIFVCIAALIFIASAGWIAAQLTHSLGFFVAAALSWYISVIFVRKKRLALPAILLLISFVANTVAGISFLMISLGFEDETAIFAAAGIGALAAWAHWKVFHVPITVAACIASLLACFLSLIYQIDSLEPFYSWFVLLCGLLTFLLAMSWDIRDTLRKTTKSDVAFWLHFLAAPLIVHSLFSGLDFIYEVSLVSVIKVTVIYFILALISIVVDRRALMVSSLFYVVFVFTLFFKSHGFVTSSLAISGVVIGSALLLLSVYWHKTRSVLMKAFPERVLKWLPPVNQI